ncbi:MAG TPA: ABATE domain-containing protein [Gemmatimonadales bacterium]|nr:ABATE domain-containing protein [Gemmatimonadales bacterium]
MSDAEFLLLGDALWLDFVNTQGAPGRAEALADPQAYLRWTKALRLEAPETAVAFAEALRFRDQLTRLAQALEAGRTPPAGAIEAINTRLAARPGAERLVRVGGAWRVRYAPDRAPTAVEAIARSAAETLATPVAVVRSCANPACGLFLLDETSNQSRRWCSGTRCGKLGRTERRRRTRLTPIVNET